MIDRFIRVDHAGEFGADRIYAGQLAVLGPKGMFIIKGVAPGAARGHLPSQYFEIVT